MYTGKVTQNDDGSYTSSHGHTITKGPDGQLYSGGAPVGLSQSLTGGIIPTSWTGTDQAPGLWGSQQGGASATVIAYAGPYDPRAQHAPSLLALPLYLWMVFLGVIGGILISATPSIAPIGLRMHPALGVGAALAAIGLYRYLMSWFPTAVTVAVASTSMWSIFTWTLRHPADARVMLPRTPLEILESPAAFVDRSVQALLAVPDLWVAAVIVLGLGLHVDYWRHRRRVVRKFGWLFNRGLGHAVKVLLALTGVSAALGFVIAWMR